MAKSSSGGTGCLVLFCLPFAAIGVVILALMLRNCADAIAMRSWREAPATIHTLDLQSHRDNEGDTTYEMVASYSYTYYGQTFTGERVAIGSGADNVGSYWQDLQDRLNEARANGTAVCFVNPNNPAEAILDPTLRWGMIAFQATFALIFGGVGFGLGIGAIVMARRAKAKARLKAEAPDQVWSADPRWRDGVIRAEGSGTAWILIGITIFWNALSWPVVIFGIPEMIKDKEYWPILIVLIFPLVGLGLAAASLYTLLRSFKYGRPLLKPPQLPLRSGQRIEAQVTGTRTVEAHGPISCSLICGQMVTSGSGKNRRTSEHILWKMDDGRRPHGARHRGLVDADQPSSARGCRGHR